MDYGRRPGITLIEVLVAMLVVVILTFLLVPALARAREENRKRDCAANLQQLGKAIIAYIQGYNEFYPFTWGPATSSAPNPSTGLYAAGTQCCDAATSIGCLYPQYVPSAKVFKCPSTNDAPSFLMVAPFMTGTATPATRGYLFSKRTFSLISVNPDKGWGASYGYDCRMYASAVSSHAIMADMDGSGQLNPNSSTQNHLLGQNVLYVDGSVLWKTANYCSNDPIDNIYSEGGDDISAAGGTQRVYWSADTDSFVVRGSAVLGLSWDEYQSYQAFYLSPPKLIASAQGERP